MDNNQKLIRAGIIGLLTQHPYLAAWDLATGLGIDPGDFGGCGTPGPGDKAIRALISEGIIEELPDLGCRYRLVEQRQAESGSAALEAGTGNPEAAPVAATNLVRRLQDILERNDQMTADNGRCPWCGAEEYGVDENGNRVSGGEADEFRTDHEEYCAVTLIEAALAACLEAAPVDGARR